MDMTIGRGDDARLVFLPDLLKPQLVRVNRYATHQHPATEWQQQQAVDLSLLPLPVAA